MSFIQLPAAFAACSPGSAAGSGNRAAFPGVFLAVDCVSGALKGGGGSGMWHDVGTYNFLRCMRFFGNIFMASLGSACWETPKNVITKIGGNDIGFSCKSFVFPQFSKTKVKDFRHGLFFVVSELPLLRNAQKFNKE
jgi:hypothetical protein